MPVPRFSPGFVLEGGAIDGDGAGVVVTTESCLLHPNRHPGAVPAKALIERRLGDCLGAQRVLWLGEGIAGDDTDGHVDDITRFIAEGVLVTAVEPDPTDPNHDPLRRNLQRLRELRRSSGAAFEIVELPMPTPVMADGARCPASYANFYLANGVVLVPAFGGANDARAQAILRELLAPREVVMIPSRDLIVGLGAVHCLTQSQPT
jgi:agmatine deiminase